jgi:hypothetical protein
MGSFSNDTSAKAQHHNRLEHLRRSLETNERLGDRAGAAAIRRSIAEVTRQGPDKGYGSPRSRGEVK